jgi:hypothetical protein
MSNHGLLWKKYMVEIFDIMDSIYLKPAEERRHLHPYEKSRKLSEIEMILDRIKLINKIEKRKGTKGYATPFIIDQEGNC